MSIFGSSKSTMVAPEGALPGRANPVLPAPAPHAVLGTSLTGPWPDGTQVIYLAMGCFWGAEEIFWRRPGVIATSVGYMGGFTPNPTYEEVCSGMTGHAETVMAVFEPDKVSYDDILKVFWEAHDPTQGMRQGNDTGTQYRSAIYWTSEAQRAAADRSRDAYAKALKARGLGGITTEIKQAGPFYFAETHHQQYLAKNPFGYCGLAGTGGSCPVGAPVAAG